MLTLPIIIFCDLYNYQAVDTAGERQPDHCKAGPWDNQWQAKHLWGCITSCHVSKDLSNLWRRYVWNFRHNDEPFSKFAFILGKYDQWDLGNLTLTNTRDFAMFMALDSAQLGVNRTKAMEKFKRTLKGKSVAEYCATLKNPWLIKIRKK